MATAINEKSEDKESVGLYDRPLVVEGKRQRKTVESFAIKHEPKSVAKYEGGSGTKLGDIPFIEHFLIRHTAVELKPLHKLCLDRPGTKQEIKKNLREFSGFTFSKDSDQYKKKKSTLEKLQKTNLRFFIEVLGLRVTGSKEEQVERILEFLIAPTDSGKTPPTRKRKPSASGKRKNSKSGSKKAKRSSQTDSSEDEGNVSFDDEQIENESDNEDAGEEEIDVDVTAPTDSELFDIVKDILKGADLEAVTNNTVCKQVFGRFPGIELTGKRDYIKSCIQKVLASN